MNVYLFSRLLLALGLSTSLLIAMEGPRLLIPETRPDSYSADRPKRGLVDAPGADCGFISLVIPSGEHEDSKDRFVVHSYMKTVIQSRLRVAVHEGNSREVVAAVAAGANVKEPYDREERTLLHFAAEHGDVAMVQLLLDFGAAVNAKLSTNGTTPLHYAAYCNWPEVARILLAHGADKNIENIEGFRPIHYAVTYGNLAVVPLLAPGRFRESCTKSQDGVALQHLAVVEGNADMLRLLDRLGVDINALDDQGQTPLDYAEELQGRAVGLSLDPADKDRAIYQKYDDLINAICFCGGRRGEEIMCEQAVARAAIVAAGLFKDSSGV